MTTYGVIPDICVDLETQSLVRGILRSVSDDLRIEPPSVRYVADVNPRTLPEVWRQRMGAKRYDEAAPVHAWAEGWTARSATIFLVYPASGTLAASVCHEARHLAQRLRGVGPSDPTDRAALELDAEAYARSFLNLPMPPGPPRDARRDAIPASVEAALLQAERDLHDSLFVDVLAAQNRELYRQRMGSADCGTSGTRRRYVRAVSPIIAARLAGVPLPPGPERRIEHAERFGGPRRP
jgi:hypothetical protein